MLKHLGLGLLCVLTWGCSSASDAADKEQATAVVLDAQGDAAVPSLSSEDSDSSAEESERKGYLANKAEARSETEAVLQMVLDGDPKKAMLELGGFSNLSVDQVKAVSEQLHEQRPLSEKMGEPLGIERVQAIEVGDSLYRLRYLEKYEMSPVVWEFDFYHSSQGWILNTFNWTESTTHLFDAAQ